jgi:hypothetical protein
MSSAVARDKYHPCIPSRITWGMSTHIPIPPNMDGMEVVCREDCPIEDGTQTNVSRHRPRPPSMVRIVVASNLIEIDLVGLKDDGVAMPDSNRPRRSPVPLPSTSYEYLDISDDDFPPVDWILRPRMQERDSQHTPNLQRPGEQAGLAGDTETSSHRLSFQLPNSQLEATCSLRNDFIAMSQIGQFAEVSISADSPKSMAKILLMLYANFVQPGQTTYTFNGAWKSTTLTDVKQLYVDISRYNFTV